MVKRQQAEAINLYKLARREQLLQQAFTNTRLLWGSLLAILLLVVALFAPWLSTYKPLEVDIVNRLAGPSTQHLFGTDNFGRDVFSRVLHGLRNSVQVGFIASLLASAIGLVVGLYAAMYRWLDQLLMRIMDALFAFPAILLAIAIMAALGASMLNLMMCLAIVFIPSVARIVRSSAVVAKQQAYIEAQRAIGSSDTRMIWQHIMPNTLPALIVQGSFVFAESIIVEAALSFLGAGIPAPTPSLGNQLSEGKMFIFQSWWMTLFPGIALIVAVLAVYLLGDGFRDLLDPHTAKKGHAKGLAALYKRLSGLNQAGKEGTAS